MKKTLIALMMMGLSTGAMAGEVKIDRIKTELTGLYDNSWIELPTYKMVIIQNGEWIIKRDSRRERLHYELLEIQAMAKMGDDHKRAQKLWPSALIHKILYHKCGAYVYGSWKGKNWDKKPILKPKDLVLSVEWRMPDYGLTFEYNCFEYSFRLTGYEDLPLDHRPYALVKERGVNQEYKEIAVGKNGTLYYVDPPEIGEY